MKKSVLIVTCAVAILCGNVVANTPSQDKPVSKTTTTVKKTMPVKATTTKTVHKKHVKKSE